MAKRGRLEIIRDLLGIIQKNHNSIRMTPLLRKTNLSTSRFKKYFSELTEKDFIKEKTNSKGETFISLTEKGNRYLERYQTIISFIDEFEL